jgi:hypothetical protein
MIVSFVKPLLINKEALTKKNKPSFEGLIICQVRDCIQRDCDYGLA